MMKPKLTVDTIFTDASGAEARATYGEFTFYLNVLGSVRVRPSCSRPQFCGTPSRVRSAVARWEARYEVARAACVAAYEEFLATLGDDWRARNVAMYAEAA